MIKRQFPFLLLVTCTLPLQSALAAPVFTMDDISSLQAEYQHHLKPKKKVVRTKSKVRPKSNRVGLIIPKALQPKKRRPLAAVPVRRKPIPRPAQRVATPNAEDLFAAATNGNVAMIGKLLQQGVNANSANRERETALHMAAARGKYSAVIYLVNHGANIHAPTVKNWQAIHHATRFRHANIANYLKQRGASPYAKTSDGLSAIDMARATGDRRLMGVFGVR